MTARVSGHPHLGTPDEGGDVGGLGVPVADEALGVSGLVDRGFEDPAACGRIAELTQGLDPDTATMVPVGQAQEASVGDIPSAIEIQQVPCRNR